MGLFELYDLHTTSGSAVNISTRGQVLGGDNVLIGDGARIRERVTIGSNTIIAMNDP